MGRVVRERAAVAELEKMMGVPAGAIREFELLYDEWEPPDNSHKPMLRVRWAGDAEMPWETGELVLAGGGLPAGAGQHRAMTLRTASLARIAERGLSSVMEGVTATVQVFEDVE